MNTDTTDKVLDALKPIAEKLSTTVDLLMEKYAVYIRVEAASNVAIDLLVIIVAGVFCSAVFKAGTEAQKKGESGLVEAAIALVLLAVTGWNAVSLLADTKQLALSIASPEIVLLKEVVKGFK